MKEAEHACKQPCLNPENVGQLGNDQSKLELNLILNSILREYLVS